jgi:Dioxygenase
MSETSNRVSRRSALAKGGGALAALLGGAAWSARSSEAGIGPTGVPSGAVSCVLTPELTVGPYYIAGEKVRRNITEGRPGVPLLLHLSLVDASACKPIKGAYVDIWHADADGVYSGFGAGASSRTFMRGIQATDASGVATFQTVYPGWYRGRTVHIHVKVHIGGSVVHTGQLFFPPAITTAVYKTSPYSAHGSQPDTSNPADAIFRNGGSKGMLKLKRSGSGYLGSIVMGVQVT